MAFFGDTVSRELYDRLEARFDALQDRYTKLVDQMMDMKRHDIGMPPKDFDASASDPMHSLGPKTQLAIDSYAAGDPELRKYLINRAHLRTAEARADSGVDDADEYVAELIANGETA